MAPESQRSAYRALALATALGWPIAAGVVLGAYLDRRFGSAPWLTLALTLGGFVGAVRRLIAQTGASENQPPP